MGRSRSKKFKTNTANTDRQDPADVFYMSVEEAREAIASKYEFLADRYEQKFPKHKGLN